MDGSVRGQVIFLNGVSSSGKSSVAQELLRQFETPYFALSVDAVNGARAKERTLELDPLALGKVLARTRAGFHRVVAGMANAGNDVVVDHVLSERWRLLDCLAVLVDFDVVFVGVHCALPELRRRERARGDRKIGQAESQLANVHAHRLYDIEFDTALLSIGECARLVKEFVQRPAGVRAFDRLREAAVRDGEIHQFQPAIAFTTARPGRDLLVREPSSSPEAPPDWA